MRSTCQLYLIHCRYGWQSLTFNAQSHRKGMERVLHKERQREFFPR